jgi:hypothetical protein
VGCVRAREGLGETAGRGMAGSGAVQGHCCCGEKRPYSTIGRLTSWALGCAGLHGGLHVNHPEAHLASASESGLSCCHLYVARLDRLGHHMMTGLFCRNVAYYTSGYYTSPLGLQSTHDTDPMQGAPKILLILGSFDKNPKVFDPGGTRTDDASVASHHMQVLMGVLMGISH